MVKGLRFLVLLMAVAVLWAMSPVKANAAVATYGSFQIVPVTDNSTCEIKSVVYVAKQWLQPGGSEVASSGIYEDNGTKTVTMFTNITKAMNDNGTVIMTFTLKNGTFANSLYLELDNLSGIVGVIKPYSSTSNTVTFYVDNSTEHFINFANYDGSQIVSFRLRDQFDTTASPSPASQLTVNVDGGLNSGDAVIASLDSTYGGKYFTNGCAKGAIYVVTDQWLAQLCACKLCTTKNGVDTDFIIANDNGTTIMDNVTKSEGASVYNACFAYEGSNSSSCCPTPDVSCDLFCGTTTTTTTTTGGCSMPGECDNSTIDCATKYHGLKILENNLLDGSPYKITNLHDATVTFTLTSELLNQVASVEIASVDATNKTAGTVLGSATPAGGDNVTITVAGSSLFAPENGGTSAPNADSHTPIYFTVKITPKSDASLMPTSFALSAVISGGQLENNAYLNWGTFEEWTYDTTASYVFMAPYLRSDSAVTSVIRFENAATTLAGISLYVNDPNGKGWVFVKHITVEPGKSVAVTGSDFISYASAAGITLDGSKGFAVYGVANVASDKLTVYGSQQAVGAGFRPLPIDVIVNGGIYAGQ